jgi:hypothetical protein
MPIADFTGTMTAVADADTPLSPLDPVSPVAACATDAPKARQKMHGTWRVVEIATDLPSGETEREFISLSTIPLVSA